jgi:hypothetical protein
MAELLTAVIEVMFTLNSGTGRVKRSLGNAAYRPNHQFENTNETFIGFVEFENGECNPGQTVRANIKVVYPKYLHEHFVPYNIWLVKEGFTKVVGKVSIVSVRATET